MKTFDNFVTVVYINLCRVNEWVCCKFTITFTTIAFTIVVVVVTR